MWLQLLPAHHHHHVWFVVHSSPLKVRFYASYSSEFVAATPLRYLSFLETALGMKCAIHMLGWSAGRRTKNLNRHAKSTWDSKWMYRFCSSGNYLPASILILKSDEFDSKPPSFFLLHEEKWLILWEFRTHTLRFCSGWLEIGWSCSISAVAATMTMSRRPKYATARLRVEHSLKWSEGLTPLWRRVMWEICTGWLGSERPVER